MSGVLRNFERFVLSEVFETQLGKTTLMTAVAKIPFLRRLIAPDQKTFPCTIDPDPTVFIQWRTQPGYILCLFAIMTAVNLLQQRFPLSQQVLSFLFIDMDW